MLLATDLDGTFLAGDSEQRLKLYQLVSSHPEITLVFVTGRGLESVLPLITDPTIPEPDYIICDVGCTVVDGKTHLPVRPIQTSIDERWPGKRKIEEALAHIESIRQQEVPQERRCSYFCDPGELKKISEEFERVVESLGCDLLYSADKYLDVLPRNVNKGSTLTALIDHLEIPRERVMVAGDTLNDLSMYQHDFKGVCVGESEGWLLEKTKGKANVYHALEPGCGGILEAIAHFGYLGENAIKTFSKDNVNTGNADLVMVYHRLPYEETFEGDKVIRKRPTSPNGIIPTLLSFFANGTSGSWVAWALHDESRGEFDVHTKVDTERFSDLVAARVALTQEEVDIFYKQFSKEAFWPTLHTFWERASFREDHWQVFLEVNRKFAERTAAEAAEGAVIWIHDYNLWMVPGYLREMRPDVKIAFFHHTYFPSADVFNVLPWRRDIVGSLLQCNYIGFHIPRQAENFVDVARGVTPLEVVKKENCAPRFLTYGCAVGLDEMTTEIRVNDRKICLGAHPVGLDLNRVNNALEMPHVRNMMEQVSQEFDGIKLILSVERLDFTKGIIEKLDAFERMLDEHPELIGKVTLMTVCVPAAKGMSIYDELQSQIEQAVGRINGHFARAGWTPIQFYFQSFPFEELVAYYANADVMWITPLRDGLNLVAKEYVATQGMVNGNGVLVLSEFAGAAAELRGPILTNPHDPADLADACFRALTIDEEAAQHRIKEAFDVVKYNDTARWGEDFLSAVMASVEDLVEPEKANKVA